MSTLKKVTYHDLREEALAGRLPAIVGRFEERERLTRVVGRRINNNALIVGPSGIGKTAFVQGWLKDMSTHASYDSIHLFQLDSEHLTFYSSASEQGERFREALEEMPPSIIFIDDFGTAAYNNAQLVQHMQYLYASLLKGSDVRVVLTLEPPHRAWLEREHPAFTQLFETILLKDQDAEDQVKILQKTVPHLNRLHAVRVHTDTLQEIVTHVERFPILGQLPRSAISLLDESISYAGAKGKSVLGSDEIMHVVASKTGIPKTHMNQGDMKVLKGLTADLQEKIIGQASATKKIALTLQRAKLGLRNPQKPLGSFLLLGPSGVGKTETAKIIAEKMFGRKESFIRFDMSEFQQEHTVQRLIGSPAGYVGYEQGGALTNALRREPHSLILLDEIEKAHPKIFDLFLQVLDDGRLTSGQNETVDARGAIIIATSNVGVEEMLERFSKDGPMKDEHTEDFFIKEKLMPALAKTFRLEFINRFDAILLFNPLSLSDLVQVAQLEIKKVEKRLAKHGAEFQIDPLVLEEHIRPIADPRFGARPIKRFVEETCEALLMESMLAADTPTYG
jgi:ATP-dependent Clp protease ATP-binding subunit ClpC